LSQAFSRYAKIAYGTTYTLKIETHTHTHVFKKAILSYHIPYSTCS